MAYKRKTKPVIVKEPVVEQAQEVIYDNIAIEEKVDVVVEEPVVVEEVQKVEEPVVVEEVQKVEDCYLEEIKRLRKKLEEGTLSDGEAAELFELLKV